MVGWVRSIGSYLKIIGARSNSNNSHKPVGAKHSGDNFGFPTNHLFPECFAQPHKQFPITKYLVIVKGDRAKCLIIVKGDRIFVFRICAHSKETGFLPASSRWWRVLSKKPGFTAPRDRVFWFMGDRVFLWMGDRI
jgi:hypothetical protein